MIEIKHSETRGRRIRIRQSQTADTRTCDFANVSKQTLYDSSVQHIGDVRAALEFFMEKLLDAANNHDTDKLTDIDGFHKDFLTGFQVTEWWDRHRPLNRHHLTQEDGIPADVNLIDVLDFIADCVMAGMARSGSVYPLSLPAELLERAFQNTVTLLKSEVVVESSEAAPAAGRVLCKCCFGEINGKGFSVHGGQGIADRLQAAAERPSPSASEAPSYPSASPHPDVENKSHD